MRRSGKLALVIYIIATLFGASLTLFGYTSLKEIQNSGGGDWDEIGAALVAYLGILVFSISIFSLITKFLHIKTGYKIFGTICILGDVAFILYVMGIHLVFAYGFEFWINSILLATPEGMIEIMVFAIPSIIALVSNIRSLKE